MDEKKVPTSGLIREAARNPGGWVLEVASGWGTTPGQKLPPEAIKGRWKVDATGRIEGDFIPNPDFDPARVPTPPLPPRAGGAPPPVVIKRPG
jgi:hypothetical protein